MEDVVDACALGKLKTIGHLADAASHLERAGVLGRQLAPAARYQILRVAVEHPQEHPIADGELELAVVGVVEPAGVLLSLEKSSTHLLKELLPVGEQGVHRLRARLSRGVGQQVRGRPTVHHLERGGLERRVVG